MCERRIYGEEIVIRDKNITPAFLPEKAMKGESEEGATLS